MMVDFFAMGCLQNCVRDSDPQGRRLAMEILAIRGDDKCKAP